MKTGAHSPGSWQIGDHGESAPHTTTILDRDGHKVCSVESYPYQTTGKADARLIAAAPELLAALIECAHHIEVKTGDSQAICLGDALTAIAKAKGEQ
jgi:hypothetical protein